MARRFSAYKAAFMFLIAVILAVLVLSVQHLKTDTLAESMSRRPIETLKKDKVLSSDRGQVEEGKGSFFDVAQYKRGKEVAYKPLTDCTRPELLKGYTNPCWRSTQQSKESIICIGKVILLGFHKSGATNILRWFTANANVSCTRGDLFNNNGLTAECPLDWLENFYSEKSKATNIHNIMYNDCPGCAQIGQILRENTTHIIRQSAIQYLQYTMVEGSRYIITMREPADRMVSHFFDAHETMKDRNPYSNFTLERIGNGYFHRIITDTTTSIAKCVNAYGTSECILEMEMAPIRYPNPFIAGMLRQGCYVMHINQVLKFIPKEKIYFSKMEEYLKNEYQVMKQIYRFVGLPISTLSPPNSHPDVGPTANPVWPKTVEVLRKFYMPCNVELAILLGNEKWFWQ